MIVAAIVSSPLQVFPPEAPQPAPTPAPTPPPKPIRILNLNGEQFVDVLEASKILRCSPGSVHRWIAVGRLPAVKRIGRLFVKRTDLAALLVPVEVPPQLQLSTPAEKARAKEVCLTINGEEYINVRAAAKFMGCSEATIKRWFKTANLPTFLRYGRLFVKRSDMDAMMQPVPVKVKPPKSA